MHAPDEDSHRDRLQRALGADFRLGALIGSGGFGSVYAARDVRLERDVAVKALRPDVFPTPALLERFKREAVAVASLRHPNVLPVHAVGEGDGIAFMVMPLIEGESLDDLMDREGALSPDEAVRVVAEVAAALEAAHKRGVVHRDVKPANVMLEGEERRVLLMDFGIAKAMTDEGTGMTGTGMVVGSPRYMSPEQAAGRKDVDGRSDVYSLGAVAYELMSGRAPIPADNLHELVFRQVTQEVPDLADAVPDVPAPVARAVMRSLASDREDRWQTAADFRRALTLQGGGAGVADGGRHEGEESWLSRRGPYVLVLGFLLFASRAYASVMGGMLGGELYAEWAGSGMLETGGVVVTVLLVAAGLDLLLRVGARLRARQPVRRIGRYVLGQPDWWQAWYPRGLRVRDSVWDRLPFSMKLLRTLVWLELVILPAGGILTFFVTPTFETMFRSVGRDLPPAMLGLEYGVQAAWYALAPTLLLLAWKGRVWSQRFGIGRAAFLGSLFNLRGSYWQGSPMRALLRD